MATDVLGTDKGPIVRAKINAINSELGGKAEDSAVVHDTGNETIAGVKTFTSPIITNGAINFNAPEGFLINGKIVPSVTGGNLTLTLTGTLASLSASNPAYVTINGVIRTITSDIVLTANSGTSYLNLGSAELATKETDLFPYLQWNTTTSAVNILASRIPYAGTMADLTNSNTGEKGAIGIINYNSTNSVVNIGRFAATLSAGAGYTWSVPTFTSSNLIQRPIYTTRKLQYTPVLTFSGGTTDPGSPTIIRAYYEVINDKVFCDPWWFKSSIAAGSDRTSLNMTTPFSCSSITEYRAFGSAQHGQNGVTSLKDINMFTSNSYFTVNNIAMTPATAWQIGTSFNYCI